MVGFWPSTNSTKVFDGRGTMGADHQRLPYPQPTFAGDSKRYMGVLVMGLEPASRDQLRPSTLSNLTLNKPTQFSDRRRDSNAGLATTIWRKI